MAIVLGKTERIYMKTELSIKPHATTAGRKIDVLEYPVRNFRIHLMLKHASKMLIGLLENQSGNMGASLVPRNVRQQWVALDLIKEEIEFAKAHNDPAEMSHERAYKAYLLDPSQLMEMKNVKQQRVAMELEHFAQIALSVDSSDSQGNISELDFTEIEVQLKAVEDAMLIWLGEGKDNSDTGREVPYYKHVGELVPDVDADYAQVIEPSIDRAKAHIPDVPDLDKA